MIFSYIQLSYVFFFFFQYRQGDKMWYEKNKGIKCKRNEFVNDACYHEFRSLASYV